MGTSKLKVILAELDITMKELACASGKPVNTISRIANGTKPHLDTAYDIADALGMHVNKVFPNYYDYASFSKKRIKV